MYSLIPFTLNLTILDTITFASDGIVTFLGNVLM
jgi:hypothetical protein